MVLPSHSFSNKVNVANGIVVLVRRTFSYLDTRSFKNLFCAFGHPHLESVWSPHLQKHIDKIEKMQMQATKLVDGLRNVAYDERLRRCDLTTLLFRRMRGDMIETWKHFYIYNTEQVLSSRIRGQHVMDDISTNCINDVRTMESVAYRQTVTIFAVRNSGTSY